MGKNKYGNVTKNDLEEKLNINAGNGNTEVNDSGDTLIVKFIDSGRYYEVDSNGNISEPIEIIVDEYPGDLTKGGKYDGSTEEMAYQINCIEDLVSFSQNVNSGNTYDKKYVKLMRTLNFKSIFSYNNYKTTYSYNADTNSYIEDINSNTTLMDLCTNDTGFIPIGKSVNDINVKYRGNFNGQGFEIKNIYVNTTGNAGLFGGCYLATIQNLGISGNIKSTENYAGGIVADGSCTFINCFNNADIKAYSFAGGIVGQEYATTTIENCYNTGDISSINSAITYRCAKGIGGTTTTNCYNIGKLISDNKCYAISENTIKNCYYDSLKVGNIVETETIEDIKNINIENFVNLLNSYLDDTGVYPENWKKWKIDEKNGYPTFE